MDCTAKEVIQFVRENDVKFVKLTFCDIVGRQKNISIVADELQRAFEGGVGFDGSAVRGFSGISDSDLSLRPDPTTLSILPWRPQQGRVARLYCDVIRSDGQTVESDSREILRAVEKRALDMGYEIRIGTECEFYLFELDERGRPTLIPQDDAGYCDTAPFDKAENVRRDICLTLEQMDIRPESSHHEQGPGQNEVDFKYAAPLAAAESLFAFKSVVRAVAARSGLFASFMPKPMEDKPGSGLHVNISVRRMGEDKMDRVAEGGKNPSSMFLAGIMAHAAEMTLFLNPLTNSYRRFGRMEAPAHAAWGYRNRSAMVRIPDSEGEYARMEVRSPDPATNPYLCFALLVAAGLDGIEKGLALEAPSFKNLALDEEKRPRLPMSLAEAIGAAENSAFVRSVLPDSVVDTFAMLKKRECEEQKSAADKVAFETAKYFHRV